ncbi:hypothetical protein NIES22_60850 [Calothrix brevissima NIES-22]|nr:hypothetical protein NIES22_60850 [Calothrix brevissima NIES-22]
MVKSQWSRVNGQESINFGFWILDFRLTPCINAGALIKNCGFWILDLFHELIRGLGTRLDSLNFESSIQNLKSKI